MVFAASSLTETLPKVAEAWRKSSGSKVIFSFDGSSRLAKQIKEGAPADLYFSAHPIWMDYLEEESLLLGGTSTQGVLGLSDLPTPTISLGVFDPEIQGIVVGGPADKSEALHVGDRIVAVDQGDDGELVDFLLERPTSADERAPTAGQGRVDQRQDRPGVFRRIDVAAP